MTTAPQAFTRRVRDRVEPEVREKIEFVIRSVDEDTEGNEVVVREDFFEATRPSDESLLIMFAMGARSDATTADELAVMLDAFRDVLPRSQYRTLITRFKDPKDVDVDAEALGEIFEWLLEQWQDFPTRQRSDSSPSRPSSGTRSTARARGRNSTR